jgi:glycosyltransferase involved in cell wall biosynthesis
MVGLFESVHLEGWGVQHYRPGDTQDLARTLLEILSDPEKQSGLARANYEMALHSKDSFVAAHLHAFRNLSMIAT